MQSTRKTITFYATEEFHKRLNRLAHEEYMNTSALCRKIIMEYVDKKNKKELTEN